MSGVLLAAASGVVFGLFQSVNARSARGFEDPRLATIVHVMSGAVALTLATILAGELAGIAEAPPGAIVDFAIAGLLHFLGGWSLLNLSQKRIGAARTSPLLTMVAAFAVVLAAVTLGQLPGVIALLAIGLMTAGAYVVAMPGAGSLPRAGDALPGLGAAFCWALSPIFTLRGLEAYDSALAGLTIGLLVSVVVLVGLYAVATRATLPAITASGLGLKVLAGLLVGLATWWRWAALQEEAVGVVLALSLISTPTVLLLAPIIAGRERERVTLELWAGAAFVSVGALVLIAI